MFRQSVQFELATTSAYGNSRLGDPVSPATTDWCVANLTLCETALYRSPGEF